MPVRREVDIEAPPEEVWEALATEDGRERWLEEPDRDIDVEVVDAPSRLVWWWNGTGEGVSRVEIELVPIPAGTRVVVIETAPRFPISMLATSMEAVLA